MKGSKKLKGLKPDFDVEIIPQEFDYYGNIHFDHKLEIDENMGRIEYVLSFYDLKRKHKKLIYNIMANIQNSTHELNKYKEDYALASERILELEAEVTLLENKVQVLKTRRIHE